jgi:hypothetical protein
VLLSIAIGFLIESIGSYIEFYIIDRRHPDRNAMMDKFWRYLRIAWTTEPTGQHYLRRLLAIFKFELNGFTAVLVALPGLVWFAATVDLRLGQTLGLLLPVVGLGFYLFHAATQTSFLLAELREQLLLGVGQPPFQP